MGSVGVVLVAQLDGKPTGDAADGTVGQGPSDGVREPVPAADDETLVA
jgi:hypothetical protein